MSKKNRMIEAGQVRRLNPGVIHWRRGLQTLPGTKIVIKRVQPMSPDDYGLVEFLLEDGRVDYENVAWMENNTTLI